MTPLQEARKRLADYEANVAVALENRRKAEAIMASADKALAALNARATRTDLLIERPGSVYIGSIATIKAAYVGQEASASIGAAGRKAKSRAIELVKAGEIKVSVSGEGTSLSLNGLTRKCRAVDKAALRRIAVMRRKKDKAEAAARKANAELVAAIRAEYEAGTPIPADAIADYVGERTALAYMREKARHSIPWQYASDARISEDRKKYTEHLAAAKEKRECQCADCIGERNRARWAKEHAA